MHRYVGSVERGGAMIMLKDVGMGPVPNDTRDVGKGTARWDAYLKVPDRALWGWNSPRVVSSWLSRSKTTVMDCVASN